MTEGTRSNLWVAMREAIAVIRPALVVWENVRGAYSACADSELGRCPRCVDPDSGVGHAPYLRALGRVLGDLSSLGYDACWYGLRASDVGAAHHRYRVFVFAWPADAEGLGWCEGWAESTWQQRGSDSPVGSSVFRVMPSPRTSDTNGAGAHGGGGPDLRTAVTFLPTPRADEGGGNGEAEALRHSPGLSNIRTHFPEQAWREYEPAIRRQEAAFGRLAPLPTEPGRNGKPRLSARFSEWLMGCPDGWITDVPGITRNQALKAAGNGVVPQQCAAAATRFVGDFARLVERAA